MQALGSLPATGASQGSPGASLCSASGTAPTPLSPLPPVRLSTFHKLSSQHPTLPRPRTNPSPFHLLPLVSNSRKSSVRSRPIGDSAGPGWRGGGDDRGGSSSNPLWLRLRLRTLSTPPPPTEPLWFSRGPAWTGGKGSDRLSVSLPKEKKNKTYQVVCRWD